jgi:hypothetical protein
VSYKAMRIRAEAAERAFEQSLAQVEDDWRDLKGTTRDSMTPLRILGSGVLAGWLTGIAAPLSRIQGGARLVQLASSLMTMFGAVEAREAAEEATEAADTATVVAATADPDAAQTAAATATLEPQARARVAEDVRELREQAVDATPRRSA